MAKPSKTRRGIQSIDVGLGILQVLVAADAPLTLAGVARAAGVPGSSCHRYLTSFIKAGYVRQDPISARYELGPGVIQAGLAALRHADPVLIGLEACEHLARTTGRTAQLAIWSPGGPVIVSWRMGKVPVPTNLTTGSRLPLMSSATGRAFMAYLPPVRWRSLVAREGHSAAAAARLARKVRAAGYASVSGSLIPGLSAAAATLRDARGEAAAVVALLGLSGQLKQVDIKALVEVTASASAQLGGESRHAL